MSEARGLRVLALLEGESSRPGPLLRHLATLRDVRVEVGGRLDGHDAVLCWQSEPPDAERATALAEFARRGGGILALGPTLSAWARSAELSPLAGWAPGETAPLTELLIHPAAGQPLFDRLDSEMRIRDRLPVAGAPPAGSSLLLTSPWHFTDRPLAFSTAAGEGRLVYLGLGTSAEAWESPVFARLVHRCLRQAAGLPPAPPLGVGLYGYGAIGREHAASVAATAGFDLRGVCDRSPERRDRAASEFGVATHADGASLLADPGVDLVVVGVPPVAHAAAVLEVLASGRHAVCEKPFALRAADCDEMIRQAGASGRTLTVYQSRRWDPDFVALRDAVRGGAVGDPFYMEAFIGGFSHPCSYWHSHEPVSGGTIYDWGSHYFDWILQLFPSPVVRVSAQSQKLVWHDVTNSDHVRVDVEFEGGAQATFLQSDIAAAQKPKWYLLGTAGAITGDWRLESVKSRAWTGDLVEERLNPAESPATVTVHRPDGEGGVHREVVSQRPRLQNGFYRNLGDHLLLGEPLAVPPEEARRNVAVMEAAAASIASGRPVELRA